VKARPTSPLTLHLALPAVTRRLRWCVVMVTKRHKIHKNGRLSLLFRSLVNTQRPYQQKLIPHSLLATPYLRRELECVEAGVEAALGEKVRVIPLFDDASGFENHDPIGFLDGR